MQSEIWGLNNIWIEIARELFEPIVWAEKFKKKSPMKIAKQSSEDVNSEELNESQMKLLDSQVYTMIKSNSQTYIELLF